MIKKIFHIIYNERRENSWLLVEIIAASIMLWMALDPLFTLTRLESYDDGYNIDGTYMIDFGHYAPYDYRFKRSNEDAERNGESYTHMYNIVRSLPEIESYCFTQAYNYPGANRRYHIFPLFIDSVDCGDNKDKYIELQNKKGLSLDYHPIYDIKGSNYFTTFGVKDALTGEIFTPGKDDTYNNCYVSECFAKKHFGGTREAIGKRIYLGHDKHFIISGIVKDMQVVDYDEPDDLLLLHRANVPAEYRMLKLHIRLKKGVDRVAFEKRFKEEIMPKLKAGNAYCLNIEPHYVFKERNNEVYGIPSKLTMYNSMALFALFTVFLGMLSAFWIRTSARKSDIGIMRSVGASRLTIIKQIVTEVAILVNIGFAVAMLFVLHYLYVNGFADPLKNIIKITSVEGPLHFAVVTAAAYIILMLFAIAGAAIPAWRITKILPADALREE
ncbi:MAG: ABC transporter permease [Bacteroidaceae bacterium]|nr:ABC transporter permease [Bacteroidaceae bacterium]